MRNVDGAANGVGFDVEAVPCNGRNGRARGVHAVTVVLPLVGVETFMAVVPHQASMEVLRAVLGNHIDGAAGIAAEFRLVVRTQNPHFLDGIRVRLVVHRAVGTGVHVRNAIHGEVQSGGIAVNGNAADSVGRSHVAVAGVGAVVADVNDARQQFQVAEDIAAPQCHVAQLVSVDQGFFFRTGQLDGNGFRRDGDGLSRAANSQREFAEVVDFVSRQDDIVLLIPFESWRRHSYGICSGREI